LTEETRRALVRRGLALEYATLGWNVVGAAVLAATALQADSVALASFALDSEIEVFASLVVVWQLKSTGNGRERLAMQLIGAAFFAVAAYVLAHSTWVLATGHEASTSALGTGWVAATVAVMLALAAGKRSTGRRLGNPVLSAEAVVTLVDACLAAAVLLGLLANALLGWTWADPAAALIVFYYAIREGLAAWRGPQSAAVRP
jgi:divalent metal cation (Fe/Co/Zn/Cd) transporter